MHFILDSWIAVIFIIVQKRQLLYLSGSLSKNMMSIIKLRLFFFPQKSFFFVWQYIYIAVEPIANI